VRDREHRAGVAREELLEPEHRFRIEVVRWFVEKKQVRRFEQELAECHASAFAAGEHRDGHFGVGALQRVHRLGKLAIKIPTISGVDGRLQIAHLSHERVEICIGIGHFGTDLVETIDLGEHIAEGHLNVLEHRLVFVERRLLLQDAHGIARREARFAVGNILETCHDLEQRRLAHAIRPYHADLRAGIERKRHVIEDDLVAVRLARLIHLVDEFCHGIPFRKLIV